MTPGDLDDALKRRLLLRWMMLSVKGATPILERAGVQLPPDARKLHTSILGFTTRS